MVYARRSRGMAIKHPYLAFTGIIVFGVGLLGVAFRLVEYEGQFELIAPSLVVLAAGILILYLWARVEKRP